MSNMKMQIETMQGAADRACELLKAMANRHRLLILCQLVERERSVGELAELLGIRDSGVSQHLTLLRKDGLVSARREGQTIWYALASKEVRVLISTLYDLFCAQACGPQSEAVAPRRGRRRIARDQ